MSVYVISDIHGFNTSFKALLKTIDFKKSDKLFILGDLIDRGKESKQVLDTILLLLESGYHVECLLGNHEKMLLDAVSDFGAKINWLRNGGNETLLSFTTAEIEGIPKKYFELLRTFKFYIEYKSYILVHAGVNTNVSSPFEDINSLLWIRDWKESIDLNWLGNRTIIHGHSPIKSEDIQSSLVNKEKIINIDNGSYKNQDGFGRICAIKLDDLTYYYQNTYESNFQISS